MLVKQIVLPFLGQQSTLSEALRQVKKQHQNVKFGIGVLKQFSTTCRVPNFSPSKITPPYCTIQRRSLERQSMAVLGNSVDAVYASSVADP